MLKAIHQNIVLQKVEKTNSRGIFMPGLSNDIYLVLNIGEDVKSIKDLVDESKEYLPIGVTVKNLANEYFLVTGSGKFIRNVALDLTDYYLTNEENVMAIVEEDHE